MAPRGKSHPRGGGPAAPKRLTAEERRAWRDLVADLGSAGAEFLPVALEAAACQLARMRWARDRIAENGEMVLDARDHIAPHPAIAIEHRAQSEVRRWLESLLPRASSPRTSSAPAPVYAASVLDELATRRTRAG